jgi:hypothetical protein
VWPLSGWITATEWYRWGDEHNGSVDIAAPYWTPVTAAADGEVVAVDDATCHSLEIDHGGGWSTFYCHLVRTPPLRPGIPVRAGELVGYVGRHGYATVPHLHFAIRRDGARAVIPGLAYGTWTRVGAAIPGDYPPLAPAEPRRFRFRVRTLVEVPLFAAPSEGSAPLATLRARTSLRVDDTADGFYHVRRVAEGWVPASSVAPARGPLIDLEVMDTADVHAEPAADGVVLGTLPPASLLPAFATRPGWYQVLFDYPTTYAWLAAEDARPTTTQRVAVCAESAVVRAGPSIQHAALGTLGMGDYYNFQTAFENLAGWLRIRYQGGDGWIPGWRTSGRI